MDAKPTAVVHAQHKKTNNQIILVFLRSYRAELLFSLHYTWCKLLKLCSSSTLYGSSRRSVQTVRRIQTVPNPDAGAHKVTKHPPIHGLLTSDTNVSQICAGGRRDSCEPASGNIPALPLSKIAAHQELPRDFILRKVAALLRLPRL